MVTNIKFSKFDDTPWGFRLVGGTDFEFPLTVVKVNEDSLAEKAGLVEGDIIVRINETPTINLTHLDAHALLKRSGNNFMLGIARNDETINDACTQRELSKTPDCLSISEKYEHHSSGNVSVQSVKSETSVHKEMHKEVHFEKREVHMHEEHISDEAIAEIMSGEAEVLKDHKVLGVNFKKIIPQSGILKNSEVFNTLNSEAVKSKEEIEMEQKKWSTFLQKPNRPVPRKKSDVVAEQKAISDGYKVRIVKQPKPRVAPDRTPTPEPVTVVVEVQPPEEETQMENKTIDVSINENANIPITDSDVPDLIHTESTASESRSVSRTSRSETSMSNRTEEYSKDESCSISVRSEAADHSESSIHESVTTVQKTEEQLYLEKQLSDLQHQLAVLSNLPLTIQAALDDVTKRICNLVPVISQVKEGKSKKIIQEEQHEKVALIQEDLEQTSTVDSCDIHVDANDVCEVTNSVETEQVTEQNETSADETVHETDMCVKRGNEIEIKKKMNVIEVIEIEDDKDKIKPDPDWQTKRSGEPVQPVDEQLESEHQQRLIRERTPKRPAHRAFGPLTPQERPIYLPGGRKWRNAKDAFNEEFIAEVLSSQAELIMGTTLGKTYESPLMGFDPRVNFLKYEKPEKKVNIEQSEVYRLIHHLEPERKRGVEVRPEKVAAIQDIRVS